MEVAILVIGVLGVFGAISGAVASARGHGFLAFFFLGALISPVLAIILTFIISPPKKAQRRRTYGGAGRGTTRKTRAHMASRSRSRNPYEPPGRY